MKKIAYILIPLIALFSCQPIYDIQPSGNITKELRTVENYDFTRIKLFGEIDLELTNSQSNTIEVETDEEFQEFLLVDLRGKTLEIKRSIAANLQDTTSVKVRISINNVHRLIAWRESNVNLVNTFAADSIELELQKNSKIKGEINCEKLTAFVHDNSQIELKGEAATVNLKINENSNASCNELEVQNLDVEDDGSCFYDFDIQ